MMMIFTKFRSKPTEYYFLLTSRHTKWQHHGSKTCDEETSSIKLKTVPCQRFVISSIRYKATSQIFVCMGSVASGFLLRVTTAPELCLFLLGN